MPERRVSVRATILALGRFGITPAERVKEIDRRWAARRKSHDLDLYGQQAQANPLSAELGDARDE